MSPIRRKAAVVLYDWGTTFDQANAPDGEFEFFRAPNFKTKTTIEARARSTVAFQATHRCLVHLNASALTLMPDQMYEVTQHTLRSSILRPVDSLVVGHFKGDSILNLTVEAAHLTVLWVEPT